MATPGHASRDLFLLDPSITFLNHGSFGACPKAVLAEQDRLRALLEREPVHFFVREYGPRLDEARGVLARFLHADPDGLAFVPNATHGVNAVLRSLSFSPGDELLVTDHEYNACRNALEFVAGRAGARVVVASLPFPLESETQVVEAVLACVTPRTRLALLDHVTSATGLVLPIGQLLHALEHERGVDVLVDGAHAPGQVELDLGALDPAYYTGNLHKWVCAPKGAGFLQVRADRREAIRPTAISHGANVPIEVAPRFRSEFDWVGTLDPTPWLAVPAALSFLESLLPGGLPALRARNRELALAARALLCDALGVPPPAPDEMIASLAAVPLRDGPASPPSALYVDPLQEELFRVHRIEVPIQPWPRPPCRVLRISAQIYNQIDDYERLASVLAGLTSGRI